MYTDDRLSKPEWHRHDREMRVDRTFAMNSAFKEIQAGNWWLPPGAREIDGGDLYAQLKAPTRVKDMSTGELRYKWIEAGSLDHCRHAHAYNHIAGYYRSVPEVIVV